MGIYIWEKTGSKDDIWEGKGSKVMMDIYLNQSLLQEIIAFSSLF